MVGKFALVVSLTVGEQETRVKQTLTTTCAVGEQETRVKQTLTTTCAVGEHETSVKQTLTTTCAVGEHETRVKQTRDMCQARLAYFGLLSGFGSGQATCVKQRELLVPQNSWHIDARPKSQVKSQRPQRLCRFVINASAVLPFAYSRATCFHPAIIVAGEGENIKRNTEAQVQ
jgi:hypothetical protein